MEEQPSSSGAQPSFKEKQARRRSLPPPTKATKRTSAVNQIKVQAASPEVISSLISSLSTLSPSSNADFNSFSSISQSRSTPSSPFANQSSFPPLHFNDSHDSGALGGPNSSRDHLNPYDAATPPVIRTAPARQSPISGGWNGSELDGATMLHNYWRGNRRTVSAETREDGTNMRKVGIAGAELGPAPWDNMMRRSSGMSTDSKQKSRRSHFGLKIVGSKERGGDLDERRVGPPSIASQEGLGLDIPLASPTLTAFSRDDIELAGMSEEPMRLRTTLLEAHGPNVSGPSSPVHGSSAQSSPGLGGRFVPNRRSSLQKTSNSRSQSKRRSYHSGLREPIALDDDSSSSRIKRESLVESKRQSLVEGDEFESETLVEPGRDRMTTEVREESEEKKRGVNMRGQALAESISASPAVASARAAAAAASAGASATGSVKINGGSRPGPCEAPKSDEESTSTQPSLMRRGNGDGPTTPATKVTIHTVGGLQRPSTASRIQDSTSRPGSSKGSMDLQQGSQTMPATDGRNSRLNKRRIEPLLLGNNSGYTPTRATASHTLARTSESNTRPATVAVDDKLAHTGRPSSADSIGNEIDVYLRSARLSQKIPHPQTRRIISFSEVGDPEGFAVFCCVGMGLTRYITAFYDELARSLKLRLITPDRPGIGESEAYADGSNTPLGWPDDVYAICQALQISKFSILAHSAGAIYALATALRMSQHIRGRIHLLAPWIPPSQMSVIGSQTTSPPAGAVPTSQRILRALPTPVLKVANSSFLSATSSSITSSLPKSPRRAKRSKNAALVRDVNCAPTTNGPVLPSTLDDLSPSLADLPTFAPTTHAIDKERQSAYDTRLTHAIWSLATSNANPAVDLLVCLERRAPIGFRYVDITRAVVIHHGSRDNRVPVDNVRWLAKTMRRCEVRVLEGEGHGLMASAAVMGGVLEEIAREWADWMEVVRNGRERTKTNGGKSEWGI